MVRVRVIPYPNPNPNPNPAKESHSNQSEARIPDLSYENKYREWDRGGRYGRHPKITEN